MGALRNGIYLYHYGASATKRDYNISKNSIYVQNTTSYGIYVFGTGLYPSKTVDINVQYHKQTMIWNHRNNG